MNSIRNGLLSVGLLLLGACAGVDGDVIVAVPAYQAQTGASQLSAAPPMAIKLGAFRRQLGTGELPGRIGERKTIGNISLGLVSVNPAPGKLVQNAFLAEIKAAGHRIDNSSAASLEGKIYRFALRTPVTALYWDVLLDAEISVLVKNGSARRTGRYSAVCTERTYAWPGEDIIARVINGCLAEMTGKFRNDRASVRLLAGKS
jgi:hypothetical protein